MYPILLSLRPAPNSCIFQLFSVHHRNHYNCHHYHPRLLLLWWWLLLLLALVPPLYHLEQVSVPAKLPTVASSSSGSTTITTNTNTANNNNINNNNHLAFYNSIMGHLRFNLGMAGLGSYYSFPSSSASSASASFQNNFIPKAINASNLNYNHHHYNGGNGGGPLFFQKNNPDTLDHVHRFLQSSFRLKKSLDKFHDNLAPLLTNDPSIDVFRKPLSTVINSSFLEYLINDKNKLSRKLHLLLTVLTQPNTNGTLAERHSSGQESNELISKNIAKALGKSLKTNNYSAAMKRSKKILLTNNGKDGTGALPGGGGGSLANGISRCFEPYGCFRITEPFRTIYRPINLIPEPPTAIKVAFYLRTRSNPTIPERLVYNENSEYFRSKYFRQDSNLKMIIHGYLESSDEYWINEMSLALLNRDDLNVICVDWMLGASPPYSQAVANTRLVGRIIAHFIQIIQKSHPDHIPNDQIHIIGHSLGAHIAGYTGEIITGLGQITGLDPAEPYFQYTDPMVRLDPGDARFVDVIHSDVASIMSGGFGMSQPCGHVDFYPNGGVDQPGCRQTSIKNVVDYISKEKNIFDGIRRFIGCNHARSFLIYIEAINSECPFMAFPCQTYDEFISGQCTSAMIDHHSYHQHCFANGHETKSETETDVRSKLNITCPIRLGLDSVHDYRNHQRWSSMLMMPKPPLMTTQNLTMILADDQTTDLPIAGVSKQLHYFLQTNDKHPYCQFHYNVKLLFNFRQTRKMTNAEWPFNGKLQLIVIGSRNRIQTEVVIKQENFKETSSTSHKKFDDQHQHQHSAPMIEYNLLISGGDLGKLLRVELDWRNSIPQIQRSLAMMQTKTFRKLLSGTETAVTTAAPSISTLQNFFNEIQRSLNVNQTNHHHNHPHYPPYPLSALKYRTGLIMPNGDSLSSGGMKNLDPNLNEILSPLSMLKPDLTTMTMMINVGQPTLRAISVRLLETNERTLFCVNEKEIQEMFFTWKQKQSHPMKSYTVLESGHNLLKSNQSISLNTASIDSIVSSICMHNNYFST